MLGVHRLLARIRAKCPTGGFMAGFDDVRKVPEAFGVVGLTCLVRTELTLSYCLIIAVVRQRAGVTRRVARLLMRSRRDGWIPCNVSVTTAHDR